MILEPEPAQNNSKISFEELYLPSNKYGNVSALKEEAKIKSETSPLELLYEKLFSNYPRTRPIKKHENPIQMEANLKLSQIIELVSCQIFTVLYGR